MSTFTLSGTGTQALSTPSSIAIVITVTVASPKFGQANPANWYDLGLLRLGTAQGYLPAFPLEATNMVVPCPVGTSILGYKLHGGVTITVEERAEVLAHTATLTSLAVPVSLVLSPFSWESCGPVLAATGTAGPSSGAYSLANRASLYPFRLLAPFTSAIAFVVNGTVVSGNWDVGVYDASFARLASTGSTAHGTAVTIQSVAMVLTLQPGTYWLALACDNVTQTFFNALRTVPTQELIPTKLANTSFPLPNPIVPNTTISPSNIYAFGISSIALA